MKSDDLSARRLRQANLPVVDVSALLGGSARDRAAVARAMREACSDKGFLYIVGHRVDPALIAAAFQQSAAFFALPMADKLALSLEHSASRQGYEPFKGQRLDRHAAPDLKEGFYIGRELPDDDPRILAAPGYFGANQWPALPGFRETMLAYHAACTELARVLMRGMALSLELDESYFAAFCADPLARLRLLHYPPQPPDAAAGETGAGAHTDYGGVTILAQDGNGGLQVFDAALRSWIHADPVPGSFVVNLGDMIARWTNGRYRSTLHRVVNVSGAERYSIPFFFHGTLDHVVSCIPSCLAPGETPRHRPVKVAEHFRERMQESYTP